MNGYRLSVLKRVVALVLCIGALPFVLNASAHEENSARESLMDDLHEHVGLTYGAFAKVQTSYLWRGLYIGALNTQLDANVGYGGLYFDMWWNIGTADWTFRTFQPEVDLTLGFSRWGVNAYVAFIHNFNCGFFDFNNHPEGGNALEVGLRYTVSSKIPLSILWATRVAASDGYLAERTLADGTQTMEVIRAYSTYAEISYTQRLQNGFSLYYAFGFTPWKSLYTGFKKQFAVQNIEMRLCKEWDVAPHCGLSLTGQLAVNPSAPLNVINTNIAFAVFLK